MSKSNDKSGSFYAFTKLCKQLGNESSYTAKEQLLKDFYGEWDGDIYILIRLLLTKQDLRVFHLGDKALCKVLSGVLGIDQSTVLHHCLMGGDASETAMQFYQKHGNPKKWSTLTIGNVDAFLDSLVAVTKKKDQEQLFSELLNDRATSDDVFWIIRLIKGDLHINIGPKYVLNALHPKAFAAWKRSNNLKAIVNKVKSGSLDDNDDDDDDGGDDGNDDNDGDDKGSPSPKKGKKSLKRTASLGGGIVIGVPVKPQLARPTKSYEDAMKRAPNMRAEIKYDGERLQIHKNGDTITAFSRNLKPVPAWKVAEVEPFLPKACAGADTVILDSEVLLLSAEGVPLPFGTFNVHKKSAFKTATVALFVFDCLYLNGESLLDTAFDERRAILEKHLQVIPGRVLLAELHKPKSIEDLKKLMTKVMAQRQEGLVIKEGTQTYHPNARHFLKMKKDYLSQGAMADSADLVVLGGYLGTGNKGGLISTLLLGVYDKATQRWLTVVKCGNGMSDEEITNYQPTWLSSMTKGITYEDLPDWILLDRKHLPDYLVSENPWSSSSPSQVFEIAGAEFSSSNHHTAGGISIRFPRFVRLRDDKDPKTATTLTELQDLYKASKGVGDGDDDGDGDGDEDGDAPAAKKPKTKAAQKKTTTSSSSSKTKKKNNKKKRSMDDDDDNDDDDVLADGMIIDDDEDQGSGHAFVARQKCKYGAACSRSNPSHFAQFAHPDFVNRLVCPFGLNCSRKNPLHFRDERHPDEMGEK